MYTDGATVNNLTATNHDTVTLYAVWEAKPIHSNLQRLGRKRAENRAGSI